MIDWLLAGLGLTILLLAGDALVRGAVNLSLRLGIPAILVSLTIVAFGTSAPELLIAVKAAIDGSPGIAMGNVVGSNIANILMVLGVPAMISTIHSGHCDTRQSYVVMLAVTVLFIVMCFLTPIAAFDGPILLAVLGLILFDQVRRARAHRAVANGAPADEDVDLEGADPQMPGWRIALFMGLGLVGLPLGADLLVDSGVAIARDFGISETVIGLTLIAIGTSLPELATTAMAALRGNADVALGNVIGSNMFNLLAIIGVTALIAPLPVDPQFLRVDLWVMLASSSVLVPFVFLRVDLGRMAGIALTTLYVAYLAVLLM